MPERHVLLSAAYVFAMFARIRRSVLVVPCSRLAAAGARTRWTTREIRSASSCRP